IDYDENKVAVAENCYLNDGSMGFISADLAEVELLSSEAIILMDVLHYLSPEKRVSVLEKCLESLTKDGILIIKDGLSSDFEKHKWTLNSEKWSTKWLKFNKVTDELSFFDLAYIENWVAENHLEMRILSAS